MTATSPDGLGPGSVSGSGPSHPGVASPAGPLPERHILFFWSLLLCLSVTV